jgi:ribonuclease Z
LFEIIFLGTSASAPSPHRSLPSLVVKHDEFRFMVDCGEGTQRQILESGIGFKNLNRILITHAHLDHILGLAGLLSTFMRWETIDDLEIFGSETALSRVHDLLFGVVLRGKNPPIPIRLVPTVEGVFWETNDFSISAFPVQHRNTGSLGFVFEEKGRRPFLPEKADQLQIPQGSCRRDLVMGKSITLPDGSSVHPNQVLGEFKPGTRLVVVGDAGDTASLLKVCRGADCLVIEATYLEEEAAMAKDFSHLTARASAQLALDAGVKKLVLTHLSRRYREKDVLAEAQAIFPTAVVARDFDTFQVRRD